MSTTTKERITAKTKPASRPYEPWLQEQPRLIPRKPGCTWRLPWRATTLASFSWR